MRVFVAFALNAHEAPDEVVRVLHQLLMGAAPYYKHVHADMPENDPRMRETLRILEHAGIRAWTDQTRPRIRGKECSLRRYRVYDESDWDPCELLRLDALDHSYPKSDAAEAMPRRDGLIRLAVEEIPQGVDFLRDSEFPAAVPQRVRRIVESAALRHVAFRPAVPVQIVDESPQQKDVTWDEFPEKWWELTSDIVLPPVSPSMTVESNRGEPLPRGTPGMCVVRDGTGFFGHPELRYLRSELAAIGPFDLACTFEQNSPSPLGRPLIASRRFYEACRDNKLGVRWIPVHLEDS